MSTANRMEKKSPIVALTTVPVEIGWQTEMAQAVRDVGELWELLDLPSSALPTSLATFPLRIPRAFVARMEKGNLQDPLLRQVLPDSQEDNQVEGFVVDPVGDLAAIARGGILHKYHGRVLIMTTGACPIHCRYCFRRHFPYSETLADHTWQGVVDYLQRHPAVQEVILSGGDPLMVKDERLAALVAALDQLPQLQRLRLHTRMPVVLPSRVDRRLLAWLGKTRLATSVVLHINHPQELDDGVYRACQALKTKGVTLLNQSVLLRGINDEAAVLAALSEKLFAAGILPYYLHRLDPVAGGAHFQVELSRAQALWEELQQCLPGYLVPRLVQEIPGAAAKVPINSPNWQAGR